MSSQQLKSLAKVGQLKAEPFALREFEGLKRAGEVKLKDAHNKQLSWESRFDLAYNAAHALALASLRRAGYRSENRYLVFQVIPETLGLGPEIWRILAKAHAMRNAAEYEGLLEQDDRFLEDLLFAIDAVRAALDKPSF